MAVSRTAHPLPRVEAGAPPVNAGGTTGTPSSCRKRGILFKEEEKMIDINIIRNKPELLKEGLKKRGMDPSIVDALAKQDKKWRSLLTE